MNRPVSSDPLRGLKPADVQQLARATQALQAGDRMYAAVLLLDLARSAPDHPEVLRLRAVCRAGDDDWEGATQDLARALAQRPEDFDLRSQLAAAQEHAHDHAAVVATLREGEAHATTSADWLALSFEHDNAGEPAAAYGAVQRAVELDPAAPLARLQRARCATALGHGDAAAADCRHLIARGELVAHAWFTLADLKVVPMTADELAQLEAKAAAPPATMPAEERLFLRFALGHALEGAGRHADAFRVLCAANDAARASRPWDAAAFARHVDAIRAAFASAPPAPQDGPGREVIFLVGLPRSGTTLVEQILASHSQVEGASELPYLPQLLDAESRRRGKPFPAWVADASDADWRRLGDAYLRASARWRTTKPIATDKLPENWLYAGAVMRMLPGARIIDCRRDPVETAWSCYKQLFGPGMVHFTYSFDGLAAYWRAYEALARFWAERYPGRFVVQRYEDLVADPNAGIQALLAACGLDFEPACLRFHETPRAIRTPSALQVRQPMRAASTPAQRYGPLLDPLRDRFAATGG